MAPEVLKGRYTVKADVWSVGVVAYMLLCSQVPFVAENARRIVQKVIEGDYSFENARWSNISEEAISFVKELLVVDVKRRPSALEAASLPWLNSTPSTRSITCKNETAKRTLISYARYPTLKKMVC